MSLLDFDYLDSLDPSQFQQASPYPWQSINNALSPEGFAILRSNLPDVASFKRFFDKDRGHGQLPHNRYTLEYRRDLAIPQPWQAFIAELEGPRYQKWMGTMLGTAFFLLSYHWHYTPSSCSVSPHCDSKRKLGSHIFYFNDSDDWNPDWGGQTIILDDGGKFARKSAPAFDDFISQQTAPNMGNCSLLFRRRGNSWHGVKEINCPHEHMRKVFIVVINANDPLRRLKRRIMRKPAPGY